ncbi:hypothetical protein [Marispirochaeta sp.]|jgi:hypothetical protein|uniref:hypothetical protein n=1 Tax=Marispirochaeta sp. TaxID=2038653 RepID=UPI0029C8B26D|nr:hypothetical protein [Marispirochaeta sp.]
MPYHPGKSLVSAGAALLAVLLVSGCRSLPPETGTGAYTAPLPRDAVVAASGDAEQIRSHLTEQLSRLYGKKIASIMERSRQINFSLFADGGSELLVEGDFPRFRTSLALGVSRNWTLTGRNPDTWTYEDGRAKVSLLGRGRLVFSSLGTDRIVKAWEERHENGMVRSSSLAIFIPEMKNLSSGLPLGGECRIVGYWTEGELELSFLWRFEDPRRARTALPLVKLLLWGFMKGLDPDFDRRTLSSRLDGAEVEIRGIRLSPGEIELLLHEHVDLRGM